MGRRLKVYRPIWRGYKYESFEYDLFSTLKGMWSWSDVFNSISSMVSFISRVFWSEKTIDREVERLNRIETVIITKVMELGFVGVSYLDTYGGMVETKHELPQDVIDVFRGMPDYFASICVSGYVYGDKFVVESGNINAGFGFEKMSHKVFDELIYESVSENGKDKIINNIKDDIEDE